MIGWLAVGSIPLLFWYYYMDKKQYDYYKLGYLKNEHLPTHIILSQIFIAISQYHFTPAAQVWTIFIGSIIWEVGRYHTKELNNYLDKWHYIYDAFFDIVVQTLLAYNMLFVR